MIGIPAQRLRALIEAWSDGHLTSEVYEDALRAMVELEFNRRTLLNALVSAFGLGLTLGIVASMIVFSLST